MRWPPSFHDDSRRRPAPLGRAHASGERGLALGRAQRDPVANTVAVYTRLFSEDVGLDGADVTRAGEEVAHRLGELRPDLVDEIDENRHGRRPTRRRSFSR